MVFISQCTPIPKYQVECLKRICLLFVNCILIQLKKKEKMKATVVGVSFIKGKQRDAVREVAGVRLYKAKVCILFYNR